MPARPPYQPIDTGTLHGDTDWRVELFRAIAASLVVGAHYAAFFTGGVTVVNFFFTGVDLFFVLSGYVFAPYLLERRPMRLAPFFTRRLFRIYPLYLVALAAYALLRLGDPELGSAALKHLFMLHTLEDRHVAFYFNPAFWSLPPEVEFYLCLPLFARLCRHRHGFALLLSAAIAGRLLINWLLPPSHLAVTPAVVLSFHLPGLLVEFLMGTMAYGVVQRLQRGANMPGAALAAAAGFVLLWAWGGYVAAQMAAGGDALLQRNVLTRGNVGWVAALGYAAVLAGAVPLLSRVRATSALPRLALWTGGCSYGIYLFHNLAPAALERLPGSPAGPLLGLLGIALTVAASAFLHRWYEEPLRRQGRRLAQRLSGRQDPALERETPPPLRS